MTLQDKYPTVEQSKRIAELLGENAPEGFMYWIRTVDPALLCQKEWWLIDDLPDGAEVDATTTFSAYDLAELGEMIVQINDFDPHIMGHVVRSTVGSKNPLPWKFVTMGKAAELYPTEAQARAALLIYLLEQR